MAADPPWPALLDPLSGAGGDIARLRAWASRLADLLSPALAQHLIAPLEKRLDAWLVEPRRLDRSRLYNRFAYEARLKALRLLAGTGAPFVCLKGFASAHRYYAAPGLRLVGDVDVLVRREDLARIVQALARAGFSAMPSPSRFGFTSDTSYLPILSPDGQVALDLHLEPDSWPAMRALDAAALFAKAVPVPVAGLSLLVPAHPHAFFLIVSNLGKDRFGQGGLRRVVDAAALLRCVPGLDAAEIARMAHAAGYARAFAGLCMLLEGLGKPWVEAAAVVPRLGWMTRRELLKVLAQYRSAAIPPLGYGAKAKREVLLGAAPAVAFGKRLKGLLAPATGLPPGIGLRPGIGGGDVRGAQR